MNSLKSVCSFAKITPMPFDELEQDIDPLLGRKASIKLVVSAVGVFKTTEDSGDSFHGRYFTTVT